MVNLIHTKDIEKLMLAPLPMQHPPGLGDLEDQPVQNAGARPPSSSLLRTVVTTTRDLLDNTYFKVFAGYSLGVAIGIGSTPMLLTFSGLWVASHIATAQRRHSEGDCCGSEREAETGDILRTAGSLCALIIGGAISVTVNAALGSTTQSAAS